MITFQKFLLSLLLSELVLNSVLNFQQMRSRATYVIIVSHVHSTVEHYVFSTDGYKDAAAANILSSTLQTGRQ